jgi:hypothetical protein
VRQPPLCSKHHHLVHEGRWRLTLQPDRTMTLHRPDGAHFFTGSTIDRRANHRTADGVHDLRPARPAGSATSAAA